jgi:hypothetical protein
MRGRVKGRPGREKKKRRRRAAVGDVGVALPTTATRRPETKKEKKHRRKKLERGLEFGVAHRVRVAQRLRVHLPDLGAAELGEKKKNTGEKTKKNTGARTASTVSSRGGASSSSSSSMLSHFAYLRRT